MVLSGFSVHAEETKDLSGQMISVTENTAVFDFEEHVTYRLENNKVTLIDEQTNASEALPTEATDKNGAPVDLMYFETDDGYLAVTAVLKDTTAFGQSRSVGKCVTGALGEGISGAGAGAASGGAAGAAIGAVGGTVTLPVVGTGVGATGAAAVGGIGGAAVGAVGGLLKGASESCFG